MASGRQYGNALLGVRHHEEEEDRRSPRSAYNIDEIIVARIGVLVPPITCTMVVVVFVVSLAVVVVVVVVGVVVAAAAATWAGCLSCRPTNSVKAQRDDRLLTLNRSRCVCCNMTNGSKGRVEAIVQQKKV